jgi:aspartate racemase
VSIVEATAEEARRLGLRRIAILGTKFTMESSMYPDVCGRYGIQVVAPDKPEREMVHDRYVNQMLKGDFREETRSEIVALIERLRNEKHIGGVILGGTELTLLLTGPAVAGLPALDTTALHVAAILRRLEQ